MDVHIYGWLGLVALIIVLISVDFIGHVKAAHEPTIKEAAIWSTGYICLAALFGVVLWPIYGLRYAAEYWAGWITEWSLSLDNLFVFIIIIAAFKVPRKYQQEVLLVGIIIAMVLRFAFIMIGAVIINSFSWVFYLFGAFLIYTAIAQAREGVTNEDDFSTEEYQENAMTRFIRRIIPTTQGFIGGKLIHRHHRKTYITPMFIVIIAIGSADLMFAFDSIPAIFGLTREPFIVFSATAFSLLGLRQLYFLIDGLLEKLAFLHYGLALILGFIGVKLIIHAMAENSLSFINDGQPIHYLPEPGIGLSMAFIFSVLILTTIASVWYSSIKNKQKHGQE
ncbi:MAG: TerC/Alx family metal homeostasis membrane protein [Actinomycetaceae bacterium]|nr:TerC/Alx family metal homeostasis membrane protein [Actinomycetaceae bacterium]